MSKLITLTFGDAAENHKGMEQIGQRLEEGQGFDISDLECTKEKMEARGATCEILQLRCIDDKEHEVPPAYVLVIKNGVNCLLNGFTQDQMFEEQLNLVYDKHAFMYGRVVNKHARWNLCFDDESRGPCYEEKKGRIIGYDEVPIMKSLRDQFEVFGKKASDLKVESNYYYDTKKCGIGYHGDSERRIVIAARIGNASMPMYYQWYYKGKAIGSRIEIHLDAGDMYIMSEKAVGSDWKKKNIFTLRHATGCAKFTNVPI